MKFKYLEHTADIKFQAYGKTLDEAFINSALAMFNSMYKGKVKENINKKISVEGRDSEALLYSFLEEFLFLFDSEHFFLAKVKNLKIIGNKLTAEVTGDKASNYEIHIDIKAITYNEMFVKKIKDTWICQVVLDV